MVQLRSGTGGRPSPAGGRAAQHAEQRADRKRRSQLQPRPQLLPTPAVHPDLTALAAFAAADQDRAAGQVQITLAQGQCLADAQPGAPEHDDQPA